MDVQHACKRGCLPQVGDDHVAHEVRVGLLARYAERARVEQLPQALRGRWHPSMCKMAQSVIAFVQGFVASVIVLTCMRGSQAHESATQPCHVKWSSVTQQMSMQQPPAR